jgi:histidine triad (HIT) family protein
MSETCDICQIYRAKDSFKLIYEDEVCFAMLHEAPANSGHVMVIPKKHYPILEDVPENILQRCFLIANKISMVVFENLGAHGTNLIVNNGPTAGQEHAHFMINVVPRYENDGVNFDWEMKQAKDEDLEMSKSLITKSAEKIFFGGDNSPISELGTQKLDEDEHSFMIKQLDRIP